MAVVSIVASIFGSNFVKLGKDNQIMKALYLGLIASSVISAVLFLGVTYRLFPTRIRSLLSG